MKLIGFGELMFVNDAEFMLFKVIQKQLDSWLKLMEADTYFAPPKWVMENLWNQIETITSSLNHDEGLESL